MGRNKRYYENGYPYFITTVTHKRKPIFTTVNNCKILLVAIEFFKLVLDYKLLAYCVMPDHLHLILIATGQYNPSYIMKMIKGNFARKYNRIHLTQGKVWQDRFYDKGLRTPDIVLQKIEYIHNNPVRAGLSTEPSEYPFSSFLQYYGHKYPDIPVIDPFS